ncbi:hypothetical protein FOXB_11467 [Fusarium oxysporum f. sp. conglutinans Fo5176]|uniref:Uncharacterized protein n=1 Tax=Fusarium oxysporum (strain Fo5176) TaxID=660025 RepID=F9FYI5_FUSOF|nr:hypothetical protein FOXB_11467 [Fusarium oxysporum f. sp. conglutinans Fo5176]
MHKEAMKEIIRNHSKTSRAPKTKSHENKS